MTQHSMSRGVSHSQSNIASLEAFNHRHIQLYPSTLRFDFSQPSICPSVRRSRRNSASGCLSLFNGQSYLVSFARSV